MIFIVLLANNRNVLVGGEFSGNVRLDLVTFLDVLHLRAILTKEIILVHFVRVRHVVVVMHHNVVDGRLRFLNRFSGLVNRDLVLLGRLRVLGHIRFVDGVLHLRDFRDVLATSMSDLRSQLLGILIHQIQRLDHFERVVGLLLGVLLRSLLRDLLRDFLLVPERVLVAKLRRCFVDLRSQRTGSATMLVTNKVFESTHGLPLRASMYRGYCANPFVASVVLKPCGRGRGRRDVLS